jgi:hypothetical protein
MMYLSKWRCGGRTEILDYFKAIGASNKLFKWLRELTMWNSYSKIWDGMLSDGQFALALEWYWIVCGYDLSVQQLVERFFRRAASNGLLSAEVLVDHTSLGCRFKEDYDLMDRFKRKLYQLQECLEQENTKLSDLRDICASLRVAAGGQAWYWNGCGKHDVLALAWRWIENAFANAGSIIDSTTFEGCIAAAKESVFFVSHVPELCAYATLESVRTALQCAARVRDYYARLFSLMRADVYVVSTCCRTEVRYPAGYLAYSNAEVNVDGAQHDVDVLFDSVQSASNKRDLAKLITVSVQLKEEQQQLNDIRELLSCPVSQTSAQRGG